MARRVARVLAAVLVCACAGAGCASSGESPPTGAVADRASASPVALEAVADDVQRYVAQVWPRTGRIWPGMDFSGHVLLLTDGTQTWAIDTSSRQKVASEALAAGKVPVPDPGGFALAKWKGRNAVAVRLPTAEAAAKLRQETTGLTSPNVPAFDFELATHEQFHTYVQLGDEPWASLGKLQEQGEGSRDELYPLQAEPRLQRAMVYNSLLSAYQEPERRQEHLAAAAYWHTRWATKYPQEEKAQTGIDLLEGTTQYVETMAGAMAQVKDPENGEQIRAFLTRTLKPLEVASRSEEPYAIGAAALLNADAMGRTQVKKSLAAEPATPAAQVLDGVDPVQQTAPADLKKSIADSVARQNKELARSIEPFVAAMADKKSWVLMLPDEALRGSMDAGLYTTRELPIGIKNEARASFGLTSGKVTLDRRTTGEVKKDGKTYYAVPLDPTSGTASLDGDELTLKGKNLSGAVTVRMKTDDGQRFLYAQ